MSLRNVPRIGVAVALAVTLVALVALLARLAPGADQRRGTTSKSAAQAIIETHRVNGRPMYIECHGTGAPVVILDAGLDVSPAATWADLLPQVARRTRACFYERPGIGRSPPAPPPRTSADMVAELRELLHRARVRGPYVLVGASLGGLNMQLMAAEHPEDVAGVVLLDALHPDFDRRFSDVMGRRAAIARARALAQNGEGVRFADLLESDRQVNAADPFPSVPLAVLVHSDSFDPGERPVARLERLWRELQRELAALSPLGAVEIVPDTTHRIAEDAPDAAATAITRVVAEARAGDGPA